MLSKCRRVGITGIGVLSPLGSSLKTIWNRLCQGNCPIVPLEPRLFDRHLFNGLPSSYRWVLPLAEPSGVLEEDVPFPRLRSPRRTRYTSMAVEAARSALVDAGLNITSIPTGQVGVSLGTGITSLLDVHGAGKLLSEEPKGFKQLTPFFAPKILGNTPAGEVIRELGLVGSSIASPSMACATGAHALGDGLRWIQRGEADLALCGATESCLNPLALAGFARMSGALAASKDHQEPLPQPFDEDRHGFVMAEGATVLVLEALDDVSGKPFYSSQHVYAEFKGFATSSDAHHAAAPRPDGEGMRIAMTRALADASLHAKTVFFVNAHATGTRSGDLAELQAISSALLDETTERTRPLLVTSCKGSVGHMLGAAGAFEAAITALSLHRRQLHGTANLRKPLQVDSIELPSALTLPKGIEIGENNEVLVAMSNSAGFGGANVSLVLSSATC